MSVTSTHLEEVAEVRISSACSSVPADILATNSFFCASYKERERERERESE